MAVLFKNVGATTLIARGKRLRITFKQEHESIARADTFAADFNNFWPKLIGIAKLAVPVSPNPVLRGDTVAVVDMALLQDTTPAALLRAIEGASGYWIEVSAVELLADTQAARASTNAGAAEREAAKGEEYKQQESLNPLNTIARNIGMTLNTVKWIAIAVVIIALVFYGSQLRSMLAVPLRKK